METEMLKLLVEVTLATLAILVWLFFALHAMQHLDDPIERAAWFAFFIFLFYVAPFAYFFVKWLRFYKVGKQGLILTKKENEGKGKAQLT